ncbi:DUF6084 family protein [Actinokineospora sp.]|uniref:DUF6084 family protein n=1 Tax=Actinokineospora sp. TaxID=1872133 RepID=UPI0040379578
MPDLAFECLDVRPEQYGTSPTLLFRLQIAETTAASIHAIALRVQIRIEPQRRRYDAHESELLASLFGDPSRFGDTLKPMQFAAVSVMVPSFTGSIEVDVPVPCSYDLEVATGKYFHALADGVVPMVMLFSGTVFAKNGDKFWVSQVPWHQEANYRLPIAVWRELMDTYFPNQAWVRVHRETIDALLRFKAEHALPTWDAAFAALLAKAKEATG